MYTFRFAKISTLKLGKLQSNHDSPSADSESSTPEDPDLTSDDDLDAESTLSPT